MKSRTGVLLIVLALGAAISCGPGGSSDDTSLESSAPVLVEEYLTPELRDRVSRLQASVARNPTNAENLNERAEILWEWANAYALSLRPIDPELPPTIAYIAEPLPPSAAEARAYSRRIDRYVRQLSFRDANPSAIGTLTTANPGPFMVDDYATIRQTYTVGDAPIRPGGGFLVTPRSRGGIRGQDAYQWYDSEKDGYISIRSSNPNARFETTTRRVTGIFSDKYGATLRPYFKLVSGELRKGDRVEITVGNTDTGSKGLRLSSMSSTGIRVRVWVSLEDPDQLFSLDELPFYSVGGATVGVRGFAHSIVGVGEPVDLYVRSEDAFRNRATSGFPVYRLRLNGKPWMTLADTTRAIQTVSEVKFEEAGVYQIAIASEDGKITGEVNPILVEREPRERIFWGETHGHCGFAEGAGTVDGFFEFARDDARLDFMTLSEHDHWMDDREFETLREAVIRYHRPGEFVTFLGYEWTVSQYLGGHHNVLFRTPEGRRRVGKQRAPVLEDLYMLLREENREEDVVVIPHAHTPGSWWVSDPAVERLVEIVSNFGTFEWLGRAYLAEGHQLGFIGGSDDHIGHPGLRPLNNAGSRSTSNNGGIAAIRASERTRDAIFDALRAKHTYATNGQRIILDVEVNGTGMGQHGALREHQTLKGRAIGTAPIESITIVKNGLEIKKFDFSELTDRTSSLVEVRFFSETDPHRRLVEPRRQRSWLGEIEVKGGRIESISTPNVENIHTEWAQISEGNGDKVEFRMKTPGASRSILLRLGGLSESAAFELSASSKRGELVVEHEFTVAEMAKQGGATVVSKDGPYSDSVTVRFVDPPDSRDREFEFVDTARSQLGDSYYVRVTQTNGGMAWSSPIWLMREPL